MAERWTASGVVCEVVKLGEADLVVAALGVPGVELSAVDLVTGADANDAGFFEVQ